MNMYMCIYNSFFGSIGPWSLVVIEAATVRGRSSPMFPASKPK